MRDVDVIIQQLLLAHPDIRAEQLTVNHSGADDGGLWFFGHPTSDVEVQLESGTGTCPFIVESAGSADRLLASTVQQAVRLVIVRLGLTAPAT